MDTLVGESPRKRGLSRFVRKHAFSRLTYRDHGPSAKRMARIFHSIFTPLGGDCRGRRRKLLNTLDLNSSS
jgi:hypothetical protein